MCHDTKSEQSTDDDSDILHNNNNAQYQPLQTIKKQKKSETRRRILAQSFVTSAVMLSSASCGMPVGYSAVLLPQLKLINDSMQIDDEIGSWIASVHSAATPLGSLLSGVLMDRCGRKLALQIASIPLIVGWILIGLSRNHAVLLLGRLIAGISAGLTAAAGQVLIGEISEPHLRGMFSSVPFASYSFGILLIYALGTLLPWRYVAGLSIILPLASILAFFFLPESPVWLVRHDKIECAKKALTWLRGGNSLQAKMETEALIHRVDLDNQQHKKTSLHTLFQPEVIKPFIIINVFNVMQILSGTYIIVFYAVDILSHIQGGEGLDHFLVAVLTACVRFIFSIIASILLVLIGRRTLAMLSGLGTSISALCLGTILQQNCHGEGYLAAVFVLIYVATNTVGFMILPGVMLGELFPAKIRGLAGGLTFMLFNLVLFGFAKIFPFVKGAVGVSGVFWIFGGASVMASVFLYLTLPETKTKTLSQIEDYFAQSSFFWIRRDRGWERKMQHDETEKMSLKV
ncbi:facilitated trehalose transporter Tret1-2 homolog [Anoplophora glabripennis]|uniref:facilitated trehalose transporter Tret1-2 homolog n=1 Tax=Anoplophora glabripennis TaxID=217634 RepID=UPI000873DEA4|nr:facilitated trehalose transporter Tret1-2 homolog [Anoplophora glabripennis]